MPVLSFGPTPGASLRHCLQSTMLQLIAKRPVGERSLCGTAAEHSRLVALAAAVLMEFTQQGQAQPHGHQFMGMVSQLL